MASRHDDILGLDVAMHDTLLMCIAQRICYLTKNLRCFLDRKLTTFRETSSKILSGDERHRVVQQ